MTRTFNLTGQSSFFANIVRIVVLTGATLAGLFVFAASAAFAVFIVVSVFILGLLAYAGFWIRRKLTGRPMSPFAQFQTQRDAFQTFSNATRSRKSDASTKGEGPVINARKTPEGWSVDD